MIREGNEQETRLDLTVVERRKKMVLPQDLITEILLRLPVKSLVRFKSVCKSWLFLISDPRFAKSHFELAAALADRILFIASSAPELRSIDFNASLHDDSASVAVTVDLPAPKPYFHFVEIIGSCRGFILLHCLSHLCVWNPTTGVHKVVPLSPIFFNKDAVFFTLLCGFGYDPSTDDYLVVHACYNPKHQANCAEIFSLRANAWKGIEGIHFPYTHFRYTNRYNQFGSFLNGAIHWLAFRINASINVIVAFDLVERSFSEMHLPVEFDYGKLNFCHLGVLGEPPSLYAVVGYNHSIEMWAMKEYKVQSSWTKSIVISVDGFAIRSFFPVCSTKSGDIVGTNVIPGLMKCNDKGELQELRTYCDSPYPSEVAVYTESLFSLPCDSK
ncbi:F-box/kelch-repeat protein [Glycine soja]